MGGDMKKGSAAEKDWRRAFWQLECGKQDNSSSRDVKPFMSVLCRNLGALVGGRGGSWGETVEVGGCTPVHTFQTGDIGKDYKGLELALWVRNLAGLRDFVT